MRTPILIAALILSATAAHAAPRSLSGAQSSPVETPVYKVQAAEPAKPAEQPQVSGQTAPPAATLPAQAAPVAPVAEQPTAAKQVEAKPVEAKPVKHARRQRTHRRGTVEQRLQREFTSLGSIG